MPKSKYDQIYKDLKRKIELNEFACQELTTAPEIPSAAPSAVWLQMDMYRPCREKGSETSTVLPNRLLLP